MAKAWLFAVFAGGAVLWGICPPPPSFAKPDSFLEHERGLKAFESARLAGAQSLRRLRRQREAEKKAAQEAFLRRRRILRESRGLGRRHELKKAWEKKQALEKALAAKARAEHIRRRARAARELGRD